MQNASFPQSRKKYKKTAAAAPLAGQHCEWGRSRRVGGRWSIKKVSQQGVEASCWSLIVSDRIRKGPAIRQIQMHLEGKGNGNGDGAARWAVAYGDQLMPPPRWAARGSGVPGTGPSGQSGLSLWSSILHPQYPSTPVLNKVIIYLEII